MNNGLKRTTKISLLTLTIIFVITFVSVAFVNSIVLFDGPKTIQSGYEDAYTYSIENFKNQRFTISVVYDATSSVNNELHIFCAKQGDWERVRDNNSLGITDIPADSFLENMTILEGEGQGTYEVIIPDWGDYTFVFLNLESISFTVIIKIEQQHVLWWLWIVLPSIVVVGLVTYGIVETTTKYERQRMHSDKALGKLGSKNEPDRKRSIYWLTSNGTIDDLHKCITMLLDENPLLRGSAAQVIGGISRRLEDKGNSKYLIELYEKETNERVKEHIVGALCDIADKAGIDILTKYLKIDSNEVLRFRIAEALEEIGSIKTAPVLVSIIKDENTDTLKMASSRALKK
ncbi:MAG: HEAT repeat domain-containing protein, partial [Candidatus Thorarchaeota archaeon]